MKPLFNFSAFATFTVFLREGRRGRGGMCTTGEGLRTAATEGK